MINPPSAPYKRNHLAMRAADRAELTIDIPVSVELRAGSDGQDRLTFGTWTPEQEAQVVTALRVAAALMPPGVEISLRISNGPTTLHHECISLKTSD